MKAIQNIRMSHSLWMTSNHPFSHWLVNHQMISLLRNYVNQLHWCSDLTTAYLASSPSLREKNDGGGKPSTKNQTMDAEEDKTEQPWNWYELIWIDIKPHSTNHETIFKIVNLNHCLELFLDVFPSTWGHLDYLWRLSLQTIQWV